MRTRQAMMVVALLSATALAGCKTPEEKADAFFRSGMELMGEGDTTRAKLEFRNALKYDELHRAARRALAEAYFSEADLPAAYTAYVDFVERYPDASDVRHRLAVMALRRGDWKELERHAEAVIELYPNAPEAQALKLTTDYRQAALARDEGLKAALAAEARRLFEAAPADGLMLRVVLDHLLEGETPQDALPVLDAALQADPTDRKLQMIRVGLLTRRGDALGAGERLKRMSEIFPDDASIRTMMTAWFIEQGDDAGAEGYLRSLAGAPDGDPTAHADVVRFLAGTKGPQAARAELSRLIKATEGTANARLYRAMMAVTDFEAGDRDRAIAAVHGLLEQDAETDQSRRIRVMLARMLDQQGDRNGAKLQIAEVLKVDGAMAEALKMRARWKIAEDRPSEAVVDLRAAQAQAPRDPEIMTLMASAHFREGNASLAGERLAAAVDVSAHGAAESLRYASHLRQTGRPEVAARVLESARARNPGDVSISMALADIRIGQERWDMARQVMGELKRIGTPEAIQMAGTIRGAILAGQDRHAEGLDLLEELGDGGLAGRRPVVMIIQTLLRGGRHEQARIYLDRALDETPDDAVVKLMSANLHAITGQPGLAEAQYREVAEADPANDTAIRLLVASLQATERTEEAEAWLDRGLAANPASRALRLMDASRKEAQGDIDGAITLYERLYLEDGEDLVVANNLASLITTWRDDPASLQRGFGIARRLRGLEAPAFQNTYGWIEYRRGNLREALVHLEPAAAALATDPIVQLHLGMVYADLGRERDAAARFEAAELLAQGRALPLLEDARGRMAEWRAAGKL